MRSEDIDGAHSRSYIFFSSYNFRSTNFVHHIFFPRNHFRHIILSSRLGFRGRQPPLFGGAVRLPEGGVLEEGGEGGGAQGVGGGVPGGIAERSGGAVDGQGRGEGRRPG